MPGELQALANRLYGSDLSFKAPQFISEYERLLAPLRHAPIRLLELGVQNGISMQIWREYLPAATVVGLDMGEKPDNFPSEDRFHFVRGRQDDPAVLQATLEAAGGPFDIIIDDASHIGCFTGRSFAYLFPKALKPGGYYIIEDICTAFLSGYDYDWAPYAAPEIGVAGEPKLFASHQHGMIGLVKQLMDHAMAPTARGGYTEFPIERMTILANIAILQKART